MWRQLASSCSATRPAVASHLPFYCDVAFSDVHGTVQHVPGLEERCCFYHPSAGQGSYGRQKTRSLFPRPAQHTLVAGTSHDIAAKNARDDFVKNQENKFVKRELCKNWNDRVVRWLTWTLQVLPRTTIDILAFNSLLVGAIPTPEWCSCQSKYSPE